jgi:tRNA(fMet)-specific endonuclease VapC
MSLILDSSVLIADERGTWDGRRFAREVIGTQRTAICAITASEFLHGCFRAPVGKRREQRIAFFDAIVNALEVIPFDLGIAKTHAELWADLASRGIGVGAHDLLIAATCLHLDWSLVTLNEAEFARIPGLKLVDCVSFRNG